MDKPTFKISAKWASIFMGVFIALWIGLFLYSATNPLIGSMNGGRVFIFVRQEQDQASAIIEVFTDKRAGKNYSAEVYTQLPIEVFLPETLWLNLLNSREAWCRNYSEFTRKEGQTSYYQVQVGCKPSFHPTLYFPLGEAPLEIKQLFQLFPEAEHIHQ